MNTTLRFNPLALAVSALLFAAAAHAQSDDASAAPDGSKRDVKTLDTVTVTGVPLGQGADDIVSPVAVLFGEELDARKANTLGETVSSIPGVTTTYFGPGVGRPIIRGLDGPRVAVLSDGLNSNDVSNISQDHAVALEPFLADQIEVLKGPSTLLYGSGAIGGVVNVVDGRIRESALDAPLSGRAELRYDAGSDGFTGMSRVDAGGDGYAVHVDGLYRDAGNQDLPKGKLANSDVNNQAGAVAGSIFGDWGFAGASVSRYQSDYGNPAEPGDDVDPGVSLDVEQTRYDLKAGLSKPFAAIERIELAFGHTDYKHIEFEGDAVGTTFLSDGNELRLEATHAAFGAWHGALGVQAGSKQFEAIGEEAFVPGTRTRNLGVFVIEQGEWDRLKLELGARSDFQGSNPDNGSKVSFALLSASAGARWKFSEQVHLSLNLDRAQRAPAEEELFANGPHVATATFEIGDPLLGKETSRQIELGLHYHGGRFEAELSAYRNWFDNFIFLADAGLIDDESELPIRNWLQSDAVFRGVEGEATFHLADNEAGAFDLRVYGDRVRATRSGGANLPRIPAGRLGAEFTWRGDALRAGIGAVRTFSQNRNAEFETETGDYTMLNANLAYTFLDTERSSWEAFVQGNNLGDANARLATSVVKDLVPLPGRNIAAGVRVYF